MSSSKSIPVSVYSVDKRFKTVKVEVDKLLEWRPSLSQEKFQLLLNESLKSWKDLKYRGVWFKVLTKDAIFVPTLIVNGFVYHHAKPEYVSLTKWIAEDESNCIPRYPFTNIGVGGLVVDREDNVLVVKERFAGPGSSSKALRMMWKFPGGNANQGETLGETAEREVLEETGIRTKFDSIVAFRHMQTYQFGCSDIYIVCLLKLVDEEQTLKKCSQEIEDVKWIPIETLLTQVSKFNKIILDKFLAWRSRGISLSKDVADVSVGRDNKVDVYALFNTNTTEQTAPSE